MNIVPSNNMLAKYSVIVVAFFLIIPVFFFINGDFFIHSANYNYSSGGDILKLPLPISLMACYVGLLLFAKHFQYSQSFIILLVYVLIMLLISIFHYFFQQHDYSKILNAVQTIIPVPAFILGCMIYKKDNNTQIIRCVFAVVIFIIMLLQLISTYQSNILVLSPNAYVLSVYQHMQYVTSIFVALGIYICFSDYHIKYKYIYCLFIILIGLCAILSLSRMALLIYVVGYVFFIIYLSYKKINTKNIAVAFLLPFLIFSIDSSNLSAHKTDTNQLYEQFTINRGFVAEKNLNKTNSLNHVIVRHEVYKEYINTIKNNPRVLFFGYSDDALSVQYHSAHNYYLEIIYNFGIFALIPIMYLIYKTTIKIYQNTNNFIEYPESIGLILFFLFIVIIDSLFKVGMKQPYPGILIFFMWGLLYSYFDKYTLNTGSK